MNKSLRVPLELWEKIVEIAKKHSGLENLTQTQVLQTILHKLNKK